MKSIVIYISLLFLISSDSIFGQTCTYYNFDNACANTVSTGLGCSTWTSPPNDCGSGWIRSHGTPQMLPYTDTLHGKPVSGFYAYMWSIIDPLSGILSGEGMFTPASFQAHHSYDVSFRIQSFGAGGGSILVYAAQGLNQSTLTTCGNPIGGVAFTRRQLIGQYTANNGLSGTQIDLNFTFVADNDYNQIWIFPSANSTVQYNLNVYHGSVCTSCGGNVIYNSGVAPSGETVAGDIFAGSSAGSGGSGTVTVHADQTTTWVAFDGIDLLHEFDATATTGSFDAKVVACGTPPPYRLAVDSIDVDTVENVEYYNDEEFARKVMQPTQKTAVEDQQDVNQEIKIYPSVGKGNITITGNSKDLKNAELSVYDMLGRNVFRSVNAAESSKITLDLGILRNGIYMLVIRNGTKTKSQKIIINK